jgi:GAF domain-containing protein
MSHISTRYEFKDKPSDYASLARELASLLAGESDLIANAANTTALIFDAVPRLNWAGVYLLKDSELLVGPFQGKPACVRIALGAGVCGQAAARRATIVVPDVNEFPGHIACDAASRSEIVIPLVLGDALLGVLDIDSPELARFDAADREGLERLAAIFVASVRAGRAG